VCVFVYVYVSLKEHGRETGREGVREGRRGGEREGVREGQRERNLENVTFIAPRREHFRILLAILLLLHSLKKRSVEIHKNSLAFCQLVS